MNTATNRDQITESEIISKGLTARRVTKADIDSLMQTVVYCSNIRPNGSTSVLVSAFLYGTYYLATGHSACVSVANFDKELGVRLATEKAVEAARNKLWELEGYALQKQLYN